jgi:beta-glucosidase
MKMSCGDGVLNDPRFYPGYSISADAVTQAKAVLTAMTLDEKASEMRGSPPGQTIFNQPDNATRGIKGFKFRDGPRGLCLDAEKQGNGYSTSFPVAMARGAAFDVDLEWRIGEAIGDETLASGHTMLLSPTVNILRHPFWGRAQEVYGEDPYLLGRMGTAFTAGLQKFVPACAKHYAANNIENGRSSVNSQMDTQTLREVYGRHFEMIINDGGVSCIMASYNPVNGTKATQNKELLTDMLRTEFGFKGFVLSDWWAMPGGQNPGSADNSKRYAAEAVNAGLDMELPNSINYAQLEAQVAANAITQAQITTSAGRILNEKFRFSVAKTTGKLGLGTPTTTYNNGSIGNDAAHIALAEEAAVKSMVLLKNANNTLPIKRTVKKVAVLGLPANYTVLNTPGSVNFATGVRTGDLGSSRVNHDPAKARSPFDGIKAAAGPITVVSGNNAAAAADSDFVVVIAGLTPQDEGEEYTGAGDRANFSLDGKTNTPQNALITAAAALNKPMVVVIEAGAVVDLPWIGMPGVGAVVMAWYPGMVGGNALGKLLFGDANFSGKLPISWDSNANNWPAFKPGGSVMMDYDLGYAMFDRKNVKPQFPFGYGLSYTKFDYSNLQVPCSDATKKSVVNVTVDIKNSGTVKGDEVVFLFVSYPNTTKRRHIKELKGFYRVTLDPGQGKRISIPLRVSDLRYYDMASKSWQVDTGPVQVMVGPSSDNLPLKDTFPVK